MDLWYSNRRPTPDNTAKDETATINTLRTDEEVCWQLSSLVCHLDAGESYQKSNCWFFVDSVDLEIALAWFLFLLAVQGCPGALFAPWAVRQATALPKVPTDLILIILISLLVEEGRWGFSGNPGGTADPVLIDQTGCESSRGFGHRP
jgi:hypothetical protein